MKILAESVKLPAESIELSVKSIELRRRVIELRMESIKLRTNSSGVSETPREANTRYLVTRVTWQNALPVSSSRQTAD